LPGKKYAFSQGGLNYSAACFIDVVSLLRWKLYVWGHIARKVSDYCRQGWVVLGVIHSDCFCQYSRVNCATF